MRLRSTRLTAIADAVRNKFYGAALNLRFDNTSVLDPRITFSRTTNATVTNSAGVLTYAPNNLLTFSEQFDNAAWGKLTSTVSGNQAVAPDGTTTADKFVANNGTSGYIEQSAAYIAGNSYVWSFYAKAAERDTVSFLVYGTNFGGTNLGRTYTLTGAGSVSTLSGTSAPPGSSIVSVGDGWYRCTFTAVCATGHTAASFQIRDGVNGTGTAGRFIWGAQLNVGALQPYYTTTAKNLLGYTQEFDNAAWTKSNSFVQTNQIRNNTMQGAVAGTPGTTPTNWSIVSGGGISRQIVSTGTEAGISYIDVRFFGTGSSVAAQRVYLESTATVPAATGQSWALSAYVKLVSGTSPAGLFIGFDETGPGTTYIKTDQTSLSVTDALLRYVYSAALTGGANVAFILPQIGFNSAVGVAVDFTLRIGLPQLVQGASAGDVVATYGTARAVMYTAPDGSVTADKLVENTANAGHLVQPFSSPTFAVGQTITYSVAAKAAERTFFQLVHTSIGPAGGNLFAGFDLANGTAGTPTSGTTSSIVSLGDGWYRCSFTVTAQTGSASTAQIRLALNSAAAASSYTGNGTSGILIWGAQLSDSASLDPYVYNPVAAPASTAYYGPRFDYDPVTLAPKGLLIEEQRTNLLLRSAEFDDPIWVFGTNCTYTANAVLSPDGTQNADTYTIGSTINGTYQTVAVSASTAYTFTFYVRLGTLAAANFLIAVYNNTAASFIAADVVPSQTPTAAGWTRIMYSFTTPVGCTSVRVYPFRNAAISSGTFSVWGAQLEAGAFPTSYIPTTTAAATRAADVATMIGANFSNWFNAVEGTVYFESQTAQGSGAYPYSLFGVDTFNRIFANYNTLDRMNSGIRIAGTFDASVNTPSNSAPLNTFGKGATAYKVNDFGFSWNGAAALTDTSTALPTILAMYIGSNGGLSTNFLNGNVRRLAFFPRRLSDTEIQGLTS